MKAAKWAWTEWGGRGGGSVAKIQQRQINGWKLSFFSVLMIDDKLIVWVNAAGISFRGTRRDSNVLKEETCATPIYLEDNVDLEQSRPHLWKQERWYSAEDSTTLHERHRQDLECLGLLPSTRATLSRNGLINAALSAAGCERNSISENKRKNVMSRLRYTDRDFPWQFHHTPMCQDR